MDELQLVSNYLRVRMYRYINKKLSCEYYLYIIEYIINANVLVIFINYSIIICNIVILDNCYNKALCLFYIYI